METALLTVESKIKKTAVSAQQLHNNFLLFSTSFSLVHATVDGVLVYATAELGPLLGGVSGGLLYICYAFSSVFLAKNVLYQLKTRRAVLFGMVCLLTYVSTFLIALAVPRIKWYVCIIGSITGGFGAGVMWTAQGSYYALNGSLFLLATAQEQSAAICQGGNSSSNADNTTTTNSSSDAKHNRSNILNKYAGYFATIYLCSEAVCKMMITGLFLLLRADASSDDDDNESDGRLDSWQVISFFAFTLVAWISTVFSFGIMDLSSIKHDFETELLQVSSTDVLSLTDTSESFSQSVQAAPPSSPPLTTSTISTSLTEAFLKDLLAVMSFMRDHESFRYLLPYQFSFGFCSTYMGFLVYGIILNDNGMEGYIGFLSAMSVLFAGGLAIPVAAFTNSSRKRAAAMSSMHMVMLVGAIMFIACAVFPLFMKDETVATWPVIVPLVCTYGAGRSIWENSNKALVANMCAPATEDHNIINIINKSELDIRSSLRMSMTSVSECRDDDKSPLESSQERAFAAIYFVSGLGAAVGFFIFKFFSSETIAALTVGVGVVALVSNHYFFTSCYIASSS